MIGLEPITCWLQISCSANWATSAYCCVYTIGLNQVTPTGIEPVLPPWKGDVLTAWPRSRILIFSKLKSASNWLTDFRTPRVGFEPTTLRLTAECSTAELSRTTFIIINTLHIFCKCFFHFLCTLKTTYKFKSLLHPFFLTLSYLLGYALDRLVTVSSMHYCTSTSALSTLSSSRGLTTCVGISHLEGGFTLRCLQRLSLPGLATLLCLW